MNDEKISGWTCIKQRSRVAVMDSSGKMESVLETKAATILEFLRDCAEPWR